MKFVVLLICIAGTVYYCFFHNPAIGEKIKNTLGIQEETPAPQATTELEKTTEVQFKENSLGARLAEIRKERSLHFSVTPPGSINTIEPDQASIKYLKAALEKDADLLQLVRSFDQYHEFGTLDSTEWTPYTILPHMREIRSACNILASSAKVQADAGNLSVAQKDFELAIKIQNLLLKESYTIIEMLVVFNIHKGMYSFLQTSKLPPAVRKKLVKSLPRRKDYAAALPQILDTEKKFFQSTQDMLKKGQFVPREIPYQKQTVAKIKKLSSAELNEAWAQNSGMIIRKFTDGTLSRDTKFANDDPFWQQILPLSGLAKISAALDGYKGK